MKAIIVDDEQDSREILATYLRKYCPDVEVASQATSVASGLKAIAEYAPDIVFLDIEMPYGNGFDLLDQAPAINFETIFVTAFENYAVQALNQSAAYYLLKPINIEELIQAVAKIRDEKNKEDYQRHAAVLAANRKSGGGQRMMLPTLEGFEIVPIRAIMHCEAVDNFTRFFIEGRIPLLICRTLKYVEDVLRPHGFLRIHRSHLINPEYVIRYTRGKGGLRDDERRQGT